MQKPLKWFDVCSCVRLCVLVCMCLRMAECALAIGQTNNHTHSSWSGLAAPRHMNVCINISAHMVQSLYGPIWQPTACVVEKILNHEYLPSSLVVDSQIVEKFAR